MHFQSIHPPFFMDFDWIVSASDDINVMQCAHLSDSTTQLLDTFSFLVYERFLISPSFPVCFEHFFVESFEKDLVMSSLARIMQVYQFLHEISHFVQANICYTCCRAERVFNAWLLYFGNIKLDALNEIDFVFIYWSIYPDCARMT